MTNANNRYGTLMERQKDAEAQSIAQIEAYRVRLEAQGWVQDYMNEYDLCYTKGRWRCEMDAQYGMPKFKRLVG